MGIVSCDSEPSGSYPNLANQPSSTPATDKPATVHLDVWGYFNQPSAFIKFSPHSPVWSLLAKWHESSDQEEVRSACRNQRERDAMEYVGQDLHILSSFCTVCEDRELVLLERMWSAETPLQENAHSCETKVWLLFHWWPGCGIKDQREFYQHMKINAVM